MNTGEILSILTLMICLVSTACSKPIGRTVNNVLTPAEMAIPAGRYQDGVDMWGRGQVRLPSPQQEPVLKWKVDLPFDGDTTTAFVDSEGGTWYRSGSNLERADTIVRLNLDGTVDWKHQLARGSGSKWSRARPVIALEDCIVCVYDKLGPQRQDPGGGRVETSLGYLVCLDLNGDIRWRTETIDGVMFESDTFAGRLPDNRLIMRSGLTELTTFSLSDGEKIDSFEIPGFAVVSPAGPIPLADGTYIVYGVDRNFENGIAYISRINSDGSQIWYHSFEQKYLGLLPPSLNEEGVLVIGNMKGLWAYDAESGGQLWRRHQNHPCRPLGVTSTGDFVITRFTGSGNPSRLDLINPDGNQIWSIELTSSLMIGESHVIIYEDDSILIGYKHGITLLNPDGTIRWTVDANDLGYSTQPTLVHWKFNPGPDGSLVAYAVDKTEHGVPGQAWQDSIFGLGP